MAEDASRKTRSTPRTGAGIAERADILFPWALRVAGTLRIADLIAAGHTDLGGLATAAGTDPDALRRLLRYLTCRGVFREDEPDTYGLTPPARLLQDRGPVGLRSLLDLDGIGRRLDLPFVRLIDAVRTGEAAYPLVFGTSFWDDLAGDPELSSVFGAMMEAQISRVAGEIADVRDWSGVRHVVDVGGGRGGLLTEVLGRHPEMRGTLVDLPAQAEGARRALAAAGLADRCAVAAGSFFDPLPQGDLHLLSSVLHDWGDDDASAILRRCADAASPRGRVLIIEGTAGSGDLNDLDSTAMDLRMLVMMGGHERTLDEMRDLVGRSGLTVRSVRRTSSRTLIECAPA